MSSLISIIVMILVISSVEGQNQNQISTPCTSSMISNFTGCANLITGSTNNGTTPRSTCCDSLRSLMSRSAECACMVISANVPFQLPITTPLSLSFLQACNINGLPPQCKASGSPLPAPGPATLGGNDPTLAPTAASPLSPGAGGSKVGKMKSRRLAEAEAEAEAPASAAVEVEAPTTTPGIRPILTPPDSSSFSYPSYVSFSPFLLLFIATIILASTTF